MVGWLLSTRISVVPTCLFRKKDYFNEANYAPTCATVSGRGVCFSSCSTGPQVALSISASSSSVRSGMYHSQRTVQALANSLIEFTMLMPQTAFLLLSKKKVNAVEAASAGSGGCQSQYARTVYRTSCFDVYLGLLHSPCGVSIWYRLCCWLHA